MTMTENNERRNRVYRLMEDNSPYNEDPESAPVDILTDLMHLLNHEDWDGDDFDLALRRARTHYAAETDNDDDD